LKNGNVPPPQQWKKQIIRAVGMLQSGEGADCVIEVQEQLEQRPNDDGSSPKRKCTSKIGQAGEGTQQQQQDVQSNFEI
jgi:hypothetical protein